MKSIQPILLVTAAVLFAAPTQPVIATRAAKTVAVSGLTFRDANRNGKLDPYEDWRLSPAERARDLVSRMTLEEKAGAMMHGTAPGLGAPGGFSTRGYDIDAARKLVVGANVTSMISRLALAPAQLAAQNNALQAVAESGRLGIPLTLSTDPRHHFLYVPGASVESKGISQWPETLGFAALKDAALVRRFADIARREYRALGFHMALSPQADLATEPRWPRISGTFGEDPDVVGDMVRAYIEGFQGGSNGVDATGVAAIVKHWVGYGAAKDGFDSHSYYGRFAQISEKELAVHLKPWECAFAAHVAGVMPTYSILQNLTVEGKPVEQVGAGYNKWLLTDLLRGRYRYAGLIVSDWAITNDCGAVCRNGAPPNTPPGFDGIAMSWGVENLSAVEKFAKGVNAGIDQFGGTEDSASLLAAIRKGAVSEKRVDQAVERVLELKFRQGLFENPYVDEAEAGKVVGNAEFVKWGRETQARANVLLKNDRHALPLTAGRKVLLRGIDAEAARRAGLTVVDSADKAEIAVIRTATPHQILHPNYFFGNRQHEGDLDFKEGDPDLKAIRDAAAKIPVVVAIYLDRPAILTNVAASASAIVANFGATDDALFDALTGKTAPAGRLPFELPRSMDSVRRQKSDAPHDSGDPLYPIWFREKW